MDIVVGLYGVVEGVYVSLGPALSSLLRSLGPGQVVQALTRRGPTL